MGKRRVSASQELFPLETGQDPLFFEMEAYRSGFGRVAGIDEAGRGPLAGPVVAAAVILSPGCRIPRLTDSKKLTAALREELFPLIEEQSLAVGVGIADAALIDRINILEATRRAMEDAVAALQPSPDYLLIDALQLNLPIPQKGIVKGDLLSHSISAASVIAKVTRDRLMEAYHQRYPDYGFKRHKGYGTRDHLKVLRELGPSPIHRKTFKRVREHCVVGREDVIQGDLR